MSNEDIIKAGDSVRVNFHNQQFTLISQGKVLGTPSDAGPNNRWVIKDELDSKVHYISEGCTVTKDVLRDIDCH